MAATAVLALTTLLVDSSLRPVLDMTFRQEFTNPSGAGQQEAQPTPIQNVYPYITPQEALAA
ncbi:hypothetical protein [Streptomyces aurantiacus]|uniref:hypothetical protein n=1 Tax=Streptomyces aurantiacus TaxID=47760 RepID=UPI0027D89707|nr:hypothetical protein [Streptomyces aurantiacus]